jgi:hypothetical protein
MSSEETGRAPELVDLVASAVRRQPECDTGFVVRLTPHKPSHLPTVRRRAD